MDVIGALALFLIMFIVLPAAVFAAAIVALGGGRRTASADMRNRVAAQRDGHIEHR